MAQSLKQIWYNEGEGEKGPFIFIFLRKSVNNHILFEFLVNDVIVIMKELSDPFLLL
jgi:hypothetical protein